MKVAIIGNMNNNGFSLMRYFNDLGVETHLFVFSNEVTGSLSHFRPECDTWEIDRWNSLIHFLDFESGINSAISYKYYFFMYIYEILRRKRKFNSIKELPTKKKLTKLFSGFDKIIGTGVSPILFLRANLKLDFFFPCGTGIEFLGMLEFNSSIKNSSFLRRVILFDVKSRQIKGIRRAIKCINPELSLTKSVFESINCHPIVLNIPMVYNQNIVKTSELNKKVQDIIKIVNNYDFKIISHSRLLWSHTNDEKIMDQENKNNDWLIYSFKGLLEHRSGINAVLVLVEYGPDVEKTKALCKRLGICNRVLWLPIMERKELIEIIRICDIGAGEFNTRHGIILGGTGWEVLSVGKPLLQGFLFKDGEYEQLYGTEAPPVLIVTKKEDILNHLFEMYDNPKKRKIIGEKAADWFNMYNGIGLAKKWLALLENNPNN